MKKEFGMVAATLIVVGIILIAVIGAQKANEYIDSLLINSLSELF